MDDFDIPGIHTPIEARINTKSKPEPRKKSEINGTVIYGQKPLGALCTIQTCTICKKKCYICSCHWSGIQVFTYETICSEACVDVFIARWKDQYTRELKRHLDPNKTNEQIHIIRKEVMKKIDDRYKEEAKAREAGASEDEIIADRARKDAELDMQMQVGAIPNPDENEDIDDEDDDTCEECGEDLDECECDDPEEPEDENEDEDEEEVDTPDTLDDIPDSKE